MAQHTSQYQGSDRRHALLHVASSGKGTSQQLSGVFLKQLSSGRANFASFMRRIGL